MTARKDREAVVLAGGFGTRLSHIVSDVPKPMAPVAGRPFLRYLLDHLAENGFCRVVIADGHKREAIESYFGNAYRGMEVAYSPEDTPLLTGGAIKQALGLCRNDKVFVFNGDTYSDPDFDAMEETFRGQREGGQREGGQREGGQPEGGQREGALPEDVQHEGCVIATFHMDDASRYGLVDIEEPNKVLGFCEKQEGASGPISAGVYLLGRDALDAMPDVFSFENEWLVPSAPSGTIAAVPLKSTFIDIGVPEDYELAQTMLAPLAKGWKVAFFDRDGTINVDIGHLHKAEDLQLIPDTVRLLKRYNDDPQWKVVVVTNQAGIAKGLYGEADMRRLHDALDERLAAEGARIDAYYFCPHHPDFTGPCECRKPNPGMLLDALRDFDAKPEECVMFGDKDTDKDAAAKAGIGQYTMV